jgi:hypothetical protein
VVNCNKNIGEIIDSMPKVAKNNTELAFRNNIFEFADEIYENKLYAAGSDSIYCFEILK